MFGTLFFKECRQILKSLTYYILVVGLVFFYGSQMGTITQFQKPAKGEEGSYGFKPSEDKQKVMEETLAILATEYEENVYVTYPVGFYKSVVLKEEKKEQIQKILEDCTGLSEGYGTQIEPGEVTESAGGMVVSYETPDGRLKPREDLTYEEFLKQMEKADEILGGGSSYAPEQVGDNAHDPLTYEEALASYEASLYEDKVSRGYARLFCDYMGLMLAILPVFLAVARSLRDKRAQADQVIYVRQASSTAIMMSRYLAAVVMISIPVLLISIMPLTQCIYYGSVLGVSVDIFAFVKYFCGWLLPSIAVTTAMGFFMTELTNGPMAILVQGIWWLLSIFMSAMNLVGAVGWNLIPRFNSETGTAIWQEGFSQMVKNRVFYMILAILLAAGATGIYHLKRRGVLGNGRKIFSNRKRVS